MIKRIQDLTLEEKQRFYQATIKAFEREHRDISWSEIERRTQNFIDNAFDDKRFPLMTHDDQIDAAYCRKEFGKNKPTLIDYYLWSYKFVTHSNMIEIPEE